MQPPGNQRQWNLQQSLPQSQPQQQQPQPLHQPGPLLSCCSNTMTPVQLHLLAYFSHHLQAQNQEHIKDNQVKPNYGEAVTRDEIVERMEEEEREKSREERSQKAGRSKNRSCRGKKAKVPVKEEPKENGMSH